MSGTRPFDHDFVAEVIARLGKLRPDAKPRWGKMTADEMVGHLIESLRSAMGRGPELPDVSTWFTRNLIGPLLLAGWLPIPKNVKGVRPVGTPNDAPMPRGDAETLHAVMDEYLRLVESGELDPPRHPAFGEIGVDGWAQMHVLHIEHHLKQFGV